MENVSLNCNLSKVEELDLEILKKTLPSYYNPSKNPISIAIGPVLIKEALVIKKFHQMVYNISLDNVKVVGVNNQILPSSCSTYFDSNIFDPEIGDARRMDAWIYAKKDLDSIYLDEKYDLTYIRNPSLVSSNLINNYAEIFKRALENTKKQGAVITQIRKCDLENYKLLLKILKQDGIKPIFSKETKIGLDKNTRKIKYGDDDEHHTIGIFKP